MSRSSLPSPPVCVLGDVDLVRALGLAGLRSVVVASDDDPVRFSRHVVGMLPRLDHWTQAVEFVKQLLEWATTQAVPPVLLPQSDGDLLLVSRHRAALGVAFRLVVADANLVESLVDKARFHHLAERLGLDVPRAKALTASDDPGAAADLRPPFVVKPLSRRGLAGLDDYGKAVRVDGEAELRALWHRVAAAGVDVLVQELVPGPETRVESWHAYLDEAGTIVGEFCGEKIRTWPPAYGHSTALRVTNTPDVRRAGRDVVERIGLRGLVKVDFKRDPVGALRLLEVNPRATLWHHPGAVAGVNLAALVHADLTGRPRPLVGPLKAGTTWCALRDDRRAARALKVPLHVWAAETLTCRARSGASCGDPAPFLRGQLLPAVVRRLRPSRTTGPAPGEA